jgi:hypothetical protein
MTITPYAVACAALLLVAIVGTSPRWKVAARRRRLDAEQRARLVEDAAWASRHDLVPVARPYDGERDS